MNDLEYGQNGIKNLFLQLNPNFEFRPAQYHPNYNLSSMSAKQSQLYMYFQNKAHHYQNIQDARPKIVDKLQDSLCKTIDHISAQKYNRDLTFNMRYEIDVGNKQMEKRLASIAVTGRKEVNVKGNYSRYNSFQRKFRRSNWAREEEEREREEKNRKIQEKIKSMKPQIGDRRFWESSYQQNTKIQKEDNTSRRHLLLQRKSFMAEAYMDFIHQVNDNHSNSGEKGPKVLTGSRTSKVDTQIALDNRRLFALPNITSRKPIKLQNSSVTIRSDKSPESTSPKPEQK